MHLRGGMDGYTNVRPVERVLVVEDDADINRMLQLRFAARGYEVGAASDGEAAIAYLADVPTDIMVLDAALPGMSGLEVLEYVREQRLDLAVILMSAFGSEQMAIDALRR